MRMMPTNLLDGLEAKPFRKAVQKQKPHDAHDASHPWAPLDRLGQAVQKRKPHDAHDASHPLGPFQRLGQAVRNKSTMMRMMPATLWATFST